MVRKMELICSLCFITHISSVMKHTIDGRQLTKGNMKMVSINLASMYQNSITLGEIYRFFYLRKLGSCFCSIYIHIA